MDSRVNAVNLGKFTWKLTYPPAHLTLSIKPKPDVLTLSASCFAKSAGLLFSFLASSKHSEEANCPKAGFEVLARGKSSTSASGKIFFAAPAKAVSHSRRKSANGFVAVIGEFTRCRCVKSLR